MSASSTAQLLLCVPMVCMITVMVVLMSVSEIFIPTLRGRGRGTSKIPTDNHTDTSSIENTEISMTTKHEEYNKR